MNREVAGRGVEQFEELQLGVFESRVGHIVNERDLEARAVEGSHRAHRFYLRQAGWDSASIHYDWHVPPLKLISVLVCPTSDGRLLECLSEIVKNIVDMLDAHAQPNHLWRHTHLLLFFRRQLAVRRGRRMTG